MFTPFIRFNGNCEEAFLWYAQVFNGKVQHLSRYSDSSPNSDIFSTDKLNGKLMHARLTITDFNGLTGGDYLEPIEKNGNISIQAHLPEEAFARKVFSELSSKGTIIAEIVENPPPDDRSISGCVQDKYGVTWIVSAMKTV